MSTQAISPPTSNGVALAATAPVAVAGTTMTREQLDLLKRTVAEGTSDDEFALFVEVVKSSGLNPFQRQIYAVMRTSNKKVGNQWIKENKMVIQTGIDGYRLIAARTGVHAGTSDAEYGPANSQGFPEWARVTVKKIIAGGAFAEFTVTARWKEYVQTKEAYENGEKVGQAPTAMWAKMPFLMLGKCAEALALRKAFPAELSGVYTQEEMSQADSDHHAPAPAAAPARQAKPATAQAATAATAEPTEAPIAPEAVEDVKVELKDAAYEVGLTMADVGQLCQDNYGHKRIAQLTPSQVVALRDSLIPALAQQRGTSKDLPAASAPAAYIDTTAEHIDAPVYDGDDDPNVP